MSGAVDDDTRESIQQGRATLGAMLSEAQSDLQKVFIVAVLGLMGTIYLLRRFVWDLLRQDLFARMDPAIRSQTDVVAITPFDVILLQVKIGIVVGLLLALPVLIWFSRDALRARGYWPGEQIPRWKLAVIVLLAAVLGVGGVAYAYFLFFPLMFEFLATNAVQVGFKPTYSIVKWAEFIFLLTISFALAAQLPLVMSALTLSGIVRYETFRDKWRHAVVAIFVFGALFSPPEPFTQFMWAVPLILLYGFSLQLSRVVTIAKRSSSRIDVPGVARERWNVLAGVALLSGAGIYGFFARGGIDLVNRALGSLPAKYQFAIPTLGEATGLANELAAAIVAVFGGVVVTSFALLYLLAQTLSESDRAVSTPAAPASVGSPTQIEIGPLDVGGVRAAPPEVFREMTEEESLAHAREAMEADNPEKAQAILDRFDEVQEAAQERAESGDATAVESEEDSSGVTETAAGMVNAFTEEETTEEDIGGYYYDIAFILESLTSKAFRIVGLFMLVLAGTFGWLYTGGIKDVKDTFFGQMPAALRPDEAGESLVDIVTLHPVEALIFEIKFSTLLAVVVTLPLILYYAWPSLKERGLVRGDPRVMLVWGGTLLLGVVGGSVLGFLYIAPAAISWLATDAIQSNMVIAYRINNFGWLVIYTTVGIGLLAEIPVSMVLFHLGGIVSYQRMVSVWRHVVVGVFAVAAFISPRGIFTMLLMALPAAAAYLLGLAVLWLVTFGGRRGGPRPDPAAD